MERFDLGYRALARLTILPRSGGLNQIQIYRIKRLTRSEVASTFDQMWDMSLAKAILGDYFVPDAQLRRVTDLVSHDGEGYLYFDGIRCENAGNGVDETSYLVDLTQKCRALESLCVTAMLSGFTVDQRHLLQPLAEAA